MGSQPKEKSTPPAGAPDLRDVQAALKLLLGPAALAAAKPAPGNRGGPPSDSPASDPRSAQFEARYRTLVEEIPAVTFLASFEGGDNELYVSPQIEAMLGFTQQEWLDDPVLWFRQLHPEDRDRWHVEFARTLVGGQPFRSNYRFIAKDGRVVWVHGEAKVVRDDAGQPLFLQGTAFDITEQIEAERVLRRSREELERLVERRTAELSQANEALRADLAERERIQAALSKSNHLLKQKNEEVEQFVFAVSHDLKSPLFTCQSFAEMAEQDYKAGRPENVAEDLARVKQGILKMRRSIEDLMEFSRVGRVRFEPTPVDGAALAREVTDALGDQVVAAGAKIEIRPEMPRVVADRAMLASAFQNLLGNALKYGCPSPGAQVVFGGRREGDHAVYFVRDHGPGIPPEYHNKVFGLFQRLDNKREGTGVGLAIVAKVAQMHGGRAWVESTPPQGATFLIALPASR